jgi:hypothetical protein
MNVLFQKINCVNIVTIKLLVQNELSFNIFNIKLYIINI